MVWNAQQSMWGRLFFDQVVNITKEHFEDVLVLPFEQLAYYDEFLEKLNYFFGTTVRPSNTVVRKSPNDKSIQIIRWLNYLCRRGNGMPLYSILPTYVVGAGRHQYNRLVEHEPSHTSHKLINKWALRIGERIPVHTNHHEQFLKEYKHLFEDWFSESNQNLAKLIDTDLKKFGYIGV
jgi:hypothetical protein